MDNLTPYVGLGVGASWLNASNANGVYELTDNFTPPNTNFSARTHGITGADFQAELLAGVAYRIPHYFTLGAEAFFDPLAAEGNAHGEYNFTHPDSSFKVTMASTLKAKYRYGLRLLPQVSVGQRVHLLGSLGVTFASIRLQGAGTFTVTPINPYYPSTSDEITKSKTAVGLSLGSGVSVELPHQLSLRALYTYTQYGGDLSGDKLSPLSASQNMHLHTESGGISLKRIMVSLMYRFNTASQA